MYATLDVLSKVATPVDLRIQAANELLSHIAKSGNKDLAQVRGWTYFRLAKFSAEKVDREGLLRNVRLALQERLVDLAPQKFREDDALKDWNKDEAFVKLYAEFERKP
jgi:hypothetical protein